MAEYDSDECQNCQRIRERAEARTNVDFRTEPWKWSKTSIKERLSLSGREDS
jgi:hypothetical protein